jgi:hypothetical protein
MSYLVNFFKYQNLLIISFLIISFLFNIKFFTVENSQNNDKPYKVAFSLFINSPEPYQIYSQYNYFNLLYPNHIIHNEIENDILDYDFIFLDLRQDTSPNHIGYSGTLTIGASVEDYAEKVKNYDEVRLEFNNNLLEEIRNSHQILSINPNHSIILKKIND